MLSCMHWLPQTQRTCIWHVNASNSWWLQGCKIWGRVDRKEGEIETLSKQNHTAPYSTAHPNQACQLHRPAEVVSPVWPNWVIGLHHPVGLYGFQTPLDFEAASNPKMKLGLLKLS